MALQDTIRFRTTKTIKTRFRRLARAQQKEPSDLGRQLVEEYVTRKEAELRAAGLLPDPAQKNLHLTEVAA